MKKRIGIAAFMTVLALAAGCSGETTGMTDADSGVSLKPVVNFEGTVSETDDNVIVLESGKKVIITENTVFGGDPDTENAVSKDIEAGNYIQGYTADNPDADEVTADNIWANLPKSE